MNAVQFKKAHELNKVEIEILENGRFRLKYKIIDGLTGELREMTDSGEPPHVNHIQREIDSIEVKLIQMRKEFQAEVERKNALEFMREKVMEKVREIVPSKID